MGLKTLLAGLLAWGCARAMPLPVLVTEGWLESHLSENSDRILALIGPKVSQQFFNSLNVKLGGLCLINRVPIPTRFLPDNALAFYPIGDRAFRVANHLVIAETGFNFNKVLDFLDTVTPGNVTMVSDEDPTDGVFSTLVDERKFPVMLLDPESPKRHLVFRAVSMRKDFQRDFKFLRFNGTQEQLAGHLHVDRAPEVAAFFYQTPRSDMAPEFDFGITKLSSWLLSKPLNYNNIVWYLKDLARSEIGLEFATSRKLDREEEKVDSDDKRNTFENALLEFNIAEKHPLRACERHLCILIIENLHQVPKPRFRELVDMTRKLQQNPPQKGTKVFLIDNACHKYLALALKKPTDPLPLVVAYDAKSTRLGLFRGNVTYEFIHDWMVSLKEGLAATFVITFSLQLMRTDCASASQTAIDAYKAQQAAAAYQDMLQ